MYNRQSPNQTNGRYADFKLAMISTFAAVFIAMSGSISPALGELVATESEAEPARADLSAIGSPAWQAAIAKATSYPPLSAGHGQITLLRIILEDESLTVPTQPEMPARPIVNGVQLFIPGMTIEMGAPFASKNPHPPIIGPAKTVQLTSNKLLGFTDFPNGGGRFREVHHGSFVIVEHINSASRKGDKDLVEIGSFTHGNTQIWVPVPPRGELGILGDVILKRTAPQRLGRIVAEIVDPLLEGQLKLGALLVGSKVVGGSFGLAYKFSKQGVTASDRLSPGDYKILLPAFDVARSRWEVTVEPGKVTYLQFTVDTNRRVHLAGKQLLSSPSEGQGLERVQ